MRTVATFLLLLALGSVTWAQDTGVTDLDGSAAPADDLFIGSDDPDAVIYDDSAVDEPTADGEPAADDGGFYVEEPPFDDQDVADDGSFDEPPIDDGTVDGEPVDGSADFAADAPAETPLRQPVERPAPDPAHQALRAALNALSATPLDSFKGFRERPLFTPSRTPPPKIEPQPDSDPEPVPDEPVAPDEPVTAGLPNLQLMGVVDGGADERVAVVRDNDAGTTVSVRSGEMIGDWQVASVEPSSMSISLDEQVITFKIFQPGDENPPPGDGGEDPGAFGDVEPRTGGGDVSGFIPPDGVDRAASDGAPGDDIVTPDILDDPLADDGGDMIPEMEGGPQDLMRRAPDGTAFNPDRAENVLKLMQQMQQAAQP